MDKNLWNPWYDWVCGTFVHFGQIGQMHKLLGFKPLVLLVFRVKSRKFHKVWPSSVYLDYLQNFVSFFCKFRLFPKICLSVYTFESEQGWTNCWRNVKQWTKFHIRFVLSCPTVDINWTNGQKNGQMDKTIQQWTKTRQSLDTPGFPAVSSAVFVQSGQNGQVRGQKTWKPLIWLGLRDSLSRILSTRGQTRFTPKKA